MFNSVLIICTGNICRSPYAEEKLRQLLPNVKVDSAGVATSKSHLDGMPADELAIDVARQLDVELSLHRAKQVSKQLINDNELILVMEHRHLDMICDLYPIARHKTFLVGQWSGIGSIRDPYREDRHVFRQVFVNINQALKSWSKKLQ